jgi:hypothetical protein
LLPCFCSFIVILLPFFENIIPKPLKGSLSYADILCGQAADMSASYKKPPTAKLARPGRNPDNVKRAYHARTHTHIIFREE